MYVRQDDNRAIAEPCLHDAPWNITGCASVTTFMHYLIYFSVATPLLVAWLFWTSAGAEPTEPMFPMFHSKYAEHKIRVSTTRSAESAARVDVGAFSTAQLRR
jgi:hypothetical protein